MNIDLLDLKAFVTVAELGSFVATAELLALSQPALSRRIQRLEATLGAPLLERTTRRVAITRAGRDFLPRARETVEALEASVRAIRALEAPGAGVITLAAVPTVAFRILPPVLTRFAALHPRVRVRILDLMAAEGLEAVLRGEADFGINFLGAADPEIAFTPLMTDPFMLACRRDHRFAAREELPWRDLAGERVVIVGRNGGNRMLIDDALAREGAVLDWSYEVMHSAGALEMVRAGIGVTVLPGLGGPPLLGEDLAAVRLVEPTVQRTIGVIRRRAGMPRPEATRLLDMLLEGTTPPTGPSPAATALPRAGSLSPGEKFPLSRENIPAQTPCTVEPRT